jgi:two-component system NtrC family response regulator
METVLIVDDEKNYPLVLSAVLQEDGFETYTANSGPEALEIIAHADVDLVLTDMKMPGMDGIALLERIKAHDPELPVIMMTAHGTVERAVEAMQKGAYHYLLKPFDNERMVLFARKAAGLYRVIRENRQMRAALQSQYGLGTLVGKSRGMQEVFDLIGKVAPTSATVLIEGESGTGKELVAKALHVQSPRRERSFVALNCSALAESLLESELFGHEKGAFTGAVATRKGRFELADGGTLFLDEIGELSAGLQVKLLRVLQDRQFERVGGNRAIAVNIRLVAATNRVLKTEVHKGRFREDLFYRLNVVRMSLPPLRQRVEDIPMLVRHFIAKYAAERGAAPPVAAVAPEVERLFQNYRWPGNVRELENVIERAMILCPGDTIRVSDLPRDYKENVFGSLDLEGIPENAKLNETLAMIERKMIVRALKRANYVQAHAAEMLGIGKSNLNQKLKRHQLEVGDGCIRETA